MPVKILDGRALAARVLDRLKGEVASLEGKVRLTSLAVGKNPSADLYERNQKRTAEKIGIEYASEHLPEGSSEEKFLAAIDDLNQDPATTGILLQRPFPTNFHPRRLQAAVAPGKDVEGMNPANIGWIIYGKPRLAPCTALAAVELARSAGLDLKGKDAVVVGHSEIVGKPIAFMLLNEFVTATICHVETRDLAAHTREADLIFVAVGKPGLITGDMVKPGALVIDIGINRIEKDGKEITVGDVDFESVSAKAGYVSPVPGGVGPMTVAMLMENTVQAARQAWA